MEPLVVSEISKTFGTNEVLKKISLTFQPGTVTAIVGDNGAGKSTLCKIIAGVHSPSHGKVLLGNTIMSALPPHSVREAGIEMIFQDLALARQHDVITNLFFGRELTKGFLGILDRKQMRKQGEQLLKETGISLPSLHGAVGRLSGGQQQAIAIARALLFSPKVLIMDEPTAALAVKEIEHVLELIHTLRARGIIVILVSHRLNDIFAVSDRIITLRAGQVAADELVTETSMERVVGHIVGLGATAT